MPGHYVPESVSAGVRLKLVDPRGFEPLTS
jgi:hypothetical protein